MKNKTIIITLTALLFVNVIHSQSFTPSMLNYSQQELFVNPAYAGSQDMFSGTVYMQSQWSNFDKSPKTQRLQVHSPFFNNKIGLGVSFQHESYAVTHNYNLSAHYAYKLKLKRGVLALGLQVGFVSSHNKYSELKTSITDPLFSQDKTMSGFSCGIGAYYSDSSYYIGLSIPTIIDNSLKEGEYKLNNKLEFDKMPFYLTGGYVFKLSSSFRLKPAVLLAYSEKYEFAYNTSLTGYYKDKVWLGALARYNKQLGGNVGVNILDYVNINYVLSFNYGDIFKDAGRGVVHEISLNVLLNLKNGKTKFKYF